MVAGNELFYLLLNKLRENMDLSKHKIPINRPVQEKARELLITFRDSESQDPDVYEFLVMACLNYGSLVNYDLKKVVHLAKKLVELDPNNPRYQYLYYKSELNRARSKKLLEIAKEIQPYIKDILISNRFMIQTIGYLDIKKPEKLELLREYIKNIENLIPSLQENQKNSAMRTLSGFYFFAGDYEKVVDISEAYKIFDNAYIKAIIKTKGLEEAFKKGLEHGLLDRNRFSVRINQYLSGEVEKNKIKENLQVIFAYIMHNKEYPFPANIPLEKYL